MAMASGSSRGNTKASMTRSSVLNNPRAGASGVLHPPGSDPSTQRNHCLRRFRHRPGINRPLATRDYRVSNSEIHDALGSRADRKVADEGTCRQKGVNGVQNQMTAATVASSRRLAAALWHLRPSEANGVEWKNRLKHSSAFLFSAMEKVTKWDPGPANVPEDIYRFHGRLKFPEDEWVNDLSVISGLQMELERTHSYINDLESEQQSAKKKLDQFVKRLAEEKELWRRRENEKARMVVEHIKDDLIRERKNRKWLEVVNAKLVDELAEATLSARRCLHDHDKERKARKIVEEACEGLAKEIGEDIAEVEANKRESLRLHEEVDEERRMLQVAEVWREERVQMKLIDAKLMLNEKHMQLCQLQGEIESFLKVQSGSNIDLKAVKEVDMLQGATKSIKVQDIVEFYYQPPASRDISSVFEDLKPREETSSREIEQYHQYDPANHVSETDAVSQVSDSFLLNYAINSNGKIGGVRYVSGDTDLETMSQVQKQASCSSPERSEPPVNGNCGKKSGIS